MNRKLTSLAAQTMVSAIGALNNNNRPIDLHVEKVKLTKKKNKKKLARASRKRNR